MGAEVVLFLFSVALAAVVAGRSISWLPLSGPERSMPEEEPEHKVVDLALRAVSV